MKRLLLAVIAIFGFGFVSTLSAQGADYLSHDLFVEELKGNVAKVEYIGEYSVTTKSYDAKGRRIPNGLTIKRDSQNRIVSIEDRTDPEEGYGEYYFYDDIGWLAKKEYWGGCTECTYLYYYSGDDVSDVFEFGISGEGEYHTGTEYVIIERDHKGNWIKRRAEYETTLPDYNQTYTNTVIETRRITYR